MRKYRIKCTNTRKNLFCFIKQKEKIVYRATSLCVKVDMMWLRWVTFFWEHKMSFLGFIFPICIARTLKQCSVMSLAELMSQISSDWEVSMDHNVPIAPLHWHHPEWLLNLSFTPVPQSLKTCDGDSMHLSVAVIHSTSPCPQPAALGAVHY